jgi:hypothetical protein
MFKVLFFMYVVTLKVIEGNNIKVEIFEDPAS